MTTTYRIERNDNGTWSHEGLGDSTGWESIELARAAIESLAGLGVEWAGEYRIVDEQTDEVEENVTIGR